MPTLKARIFRQETGLLLVPFLAALIAWLTGFVPVWSTGGLSQNSLTVSQYGLPLLWKTNVESPGYFDPRFGVVPPASFTTDSWDVFVVDALLYAGAIYFISLWSRRGASLFRAVPIIVSSGWTSSATLFYAWSSQQGQLMNGFPVPWMGLSFSGMWYYNLTLLLVDTLFLAGLGYFALFLYRGIRQSRSSSTWT